eukprot:SAG11_NODE_1667_length_4494_cov_5.922412_1_plen_207_part_00
MGSASPSDCHGRHLAVMHAPGDIINADPSWKCVSFITCPVFLAVVVRRVRAAQERLWWLPARVNPEMHKLSKLQLHEFELSLAWERWTCRCSCRHNEPLKRHDRRHHVHCTDSMAARCAQFVDRPGGACNNRLSIYRYSIDNFWYTRYRYKIRGTAVRTFTFPIAYIGFRGGISLSQDFMFCGPMWVVLLADDLSSCLHVLNLVAT